MSLRTLCSVFVVVSLISAPRVAEAFIIDIREYVTQWPQGYKLCESTGDRLCLQGYWNQYGEFTYSYSNGIIDYIARSTSPNYLAGPMRNYSGMSNGNPDSNIFRCFANYNDLCQAASNTAYPPQSLPLLFNVNTVGPEIEISTRVTSSDNSYSNAPIGAPKSIIPGSVSLTGGYQVFTVNIIDPYTCAQTRAGSIAHQVYATFVQNVTFGGNIPNSDALVIDEVEGGLFNGVFYPDHIERYYYIKYMGRVMESSARWNSDWNAFINGPGGVSNRNLMVPNDMPTPAVFCPQGSASFN